MVGYTPQQIITLLYVALGLGILGLVATLTAIAAGRLAVARGRARVPPDTFAVLAGMGCVAGGVAAQAGVRLLGIHAGVDMTNLALAIQFATIGVFYVILSVLGVRWIKRRRARGREGQR